MKKVLSKNQNKNLKYIPLSEAGRILNTSRDYMNVLVRRGKFEALKLGRNWFTTAQWIENYRKKSIKSDNNYIPLSEASHTLNTSRDYVNVLVRRGKLRAIKLGRNWFTTGTWLDEYQRNLGRSTPNISAVSIAAVSQSKPQTAIEKLKSEEKSEIENLRTKLIIESAFVRASADKKELTEILKRIESKVVSLRDVSRREKNISLVRDSKIKTFRDSEISKKTASFIASHEIPLLSRELKSEEKSKILESVFAGATADKFQKASRQLGILNSLKNWSQLKFSLASSLTILGLVVLLGLVSGIVSLPTNVSPKYQASIFPNAFKNFSSDLPAFSDWFTQSLSKGLTFFKSKSPLELTVENLEFGESRIVKPQEAMLSINTLAEAEALDSMTEEEISSSFSAKPADTEDQQGEIATGGNFTLLENRLSIVEADLKEQTDLINSELSLQKKTILGTLETLFGIAKLVPIHPISTIVVQGQPATLTTYSIAPQINTGFDRLSANYFNLANNAEINGSLTVKSGANLNSLSVSGTSGLTGNVTIGGTLSVTGDTTLSNLILTGTLNALSSQFNLNSASTTYLTVSGDAWLNNLNVSGTTNLGVISLTNASSTYLTVSDALWGNQSEFSTSVKTPLIWNSGTLTASTTGANPIIFATNSSERMRIDENGNMGIASTSPSATLSVNGTAAITGNLAIGGDLTVSGNSTFANLSTFANASTTYGTISTLWSDLATISEFNFTNATGTRLFSTNGTITNASSTYSTISDTAWLGNLAVSGNSIFNNSSTTNGTINNFWSTAGNVTNLTVANGTITNASSTYATLTNFWATNGNITNLTVTNLTQTNASSTYLTVSNTAWINNLVSTNATTTTFRSSGLATFGGNVGINTTNPTQIFQVNDSATAAFVVTSAGQVGIGTSTPGAKIHSLSAGTTQLRLGYDTSNYANFDVQNNGDLRLSTNGGSATLAMTASGMVGIGTTTPNQKLTVWGNGMFYGTLSASSTAYLPTLVTTNGIITNASSTYATLTNLWSNNATIGTLTITGSTITNASTTYLTVSNTAWINNLVATNATTTTFRSSGLATFGGNVGIGTTTPGSLLSVNSTGNIYFGGALTVSGAITSGLINGQTISSAANFTGTVNAVTGYKVNGAAASGSVLRGNGTNFVGSTATFADTYAASTLLYSNTANTVQGLATANSGVLVTSSTGVPSILGSMTNGQLVVGSTGATPVLATLTGTANQITSTVGAGTITLSIPSDFRAPGTVNAVSGFYTGATAGTLRLDANGNLSNIGTISSTYLITAASYVNFNGASTVLQLNGTQFMDTSRNLSNIGTITSGLINGQTITSAASFTGTVNAVTGYKVNGAAASGSVLRGDGTNFVQSTLILPNAATAYRLPVATSANTIGELTASGANGEYLAGVTGAIPAWATLNQAAVAGLTTASSPVFVTVKLSALTDGYIPYHVSDASGLANSVVYTDGTNVGIGTTSPSGKLQIYTPFDYTTDALYIQGDRRAGTIRFRDVDDDEQYGLGIVGASGIGYFGIWADQDNDGFDRLSDTPKLVINNNGNVGIGTTAPGAKLSVSGGGAFGSSYAATAVSDGNLIISGNVGIGTTAPRDALDFVIIGGTTDTKSILFGPHNGAAETQGGGIVWKGNYPGYTKRSAGILQIADGSGYFRSGLAFYTNGTSDQTTDWSERLRITSNGNVGIGTTTIGARLAIQTTGTTDVLNLFEASGTEVFTVLESGFVGIGTTGPGAKLSVLGSGTANTVGSVVSEMVIVGPSVDVSQTGNLFIQSNDAQAVDKGGSLAFGGRYIDANTAGASYAVIFGAKESSTSNNLNSYLAFRVRDTSGSVPERMRINSSGNVGIGTTAPGTKLDIEEPAAGPNYATQIRVGYVGGGYWDFGRDNVTTGDFLLRSSGSEKMRITTAGNVGIGTTSPFTNLQVSDSTHGYTGLAISDMTQGVDEKHWLIQNYQSNLYFKRQNDALNSNTVIMTVANTGNVGIGTTNPGYKLEIAGGSVYSSSGYGMANNQGLAAKDSGGTLRDIFILDGSNNVNFGGSGLANDLIFRSSSGTLMTIKAAGNVGIGTTAPGSLLQVVGTTTLATTGGNVGIGTTNPGYKLDVAGFVNVDQSSGYKQAGDTILYASSTVKTLLVGQGAGNSLTTSGYWNIAAGYQAMYHNQTGTQNVVIGMQAGYGLSGNSYSYNVFVGESAGAMTTTGGFNSFVGRQAGNKNTTGTDNAAFGNNALLYNQSGSYNVAIGGEAGVGVNGNSFNYGTFVGYKAGLSLTSGSSNVLIGAKSGYSLTTGGNNNFFGYESGYYNPAGVQNVVIGYQAGRGVSTKSFSSNVIIGYQAGYVMDASAGNVLIGDQAGYTVSTGSENTAVGRWAGLAITTGAGNVMVGKDAGRTMAGNNYGVFVGSGAGYTTTGAENVIMGYNAGYAATTPSTNTVVGSEAMRYNVTGGYNTIVGKQAGYGVSTNSYSSNSLFGFETGHDLTTGSSNTFLGSYAGTKNTDGTGNVFVGSSAGYNMLTGSYNVAVGMQAGNQATVASEIVAVGFSAGSDNTGNANVFVGYLAGTEHSSGDGNVVIGRLAGYGVHGSSTYTNSVFIGLETGSSMQNGANNTFVGYQAGKMATSPSANTFLGYYAGRSNTTGGYNTALGTEAGYSLTTGGSNTFLGYQAGYTATSSSLNTFVGYMAGRVTRTGTQNTAVGNSALASNTTASYNTAVGESALFGNTTGTSNTAVGEYSLRNNSTGNNNTALGRGAAATATGDNNTALGASAMYYTTSGTDNVAIGAAAMYFNQTGSHNVVIGSSAGQGISGNSFNGNNIIGWFAGGYLTTGSSNNLFGYSAGGVLTTGSNNILIGFQAGDTLTTGASNIIIGYGQDAPTAGTSNFLNIGGVIYGNLSTGYIGIGTTSPASKLDVIGTAADASTYETILQLKRPYAGGAVYPEVAAFQVGKYGSNGSFPETRLDIKLKSNADLNLTADAIIMTLQSNGNVGISTTTPTTNLTISKAGTTANLAVTNGWLCVDNDGGCVGGTAGTVYFRASATGGSDVAENYTSSTPLEPGDIVQIMKHETWNMEQKNQIEKATSTSQTIIGIISTQPGSLLGYVAPSTSSGQVASSSYPVALTGRVPVKVSLENGPIAIGDKISASSVAGAGMKAATSTSSGQATTVGMALESFDGWSPSTSSGQSEYSQIGKVMVFVNLGQPALAAQQGTIDLQQLTSDINVNGFSLLNVKSITGMNGLWGIDENGNITAQSINTQSLTVGGGAASGVTVYDRATSAPRCIYIEGGVIKTSDGACGQTTNEGTAAVIVPASDPVPPVTSTTTPDIIPVATTTPDIIPTATTTPSISEIDTATTTPSIIPASEPIIISTTTPESATTTP